MLANIGDYIIKGINGEFYPCKPDIFEKTYASKDLIIGSTGLAIHFIAFEMFSSIQNSFMR